MKMALDGAQGCFHRVRSFLMVESLKMNQDKDLSLPGTQFLHCHVNALLDAMVSGQRYWLLGFPGNENLSQHISSFVSALQIATFVDENLEQPAFHALRFFQLAEFLPRLLKSRLYHILSLGMMGAKKSPRHGKGLAVMTLQEFVEAILSLKSGVPRTFYLQRSYYALSLRQHLTL